MTVHKRTWTSKTEARTTLEADVQFCKSQIVEANSRGESERAERYERRIRYDNEALRQLTLAEPVGAAVLLSSDGMTVSGTVIGYEQNIMGVLLVVVRDSEGYGTTVGYVNEVVPLNPVEAMLGPDPKLHEDYPFLGDHDDEYSL